jgi:hypothetical protein
VGHDAKTVPEVGWASKKNGELLELAAPEFEIFLTVDRNLTFQQNLSGLQLAVIVLVASGNRLVDLKPLMPKVLRAIDSIGPGEVIKIDG